MAGVIYQQNKTVPTENLSYRYSTHPFQVPRRLTILRCQSASRPACEDAMHPRDASVDGLLDPGLAGRTHALRTPPLHHVEMAPVTGIPVGESFGGQSQAAAVIAVHVAHVWLIVVLRLLQSTRQRVS